MKPITHIILALLFLGCEKEPTPTEIAVSTGEATLITTNSASIQVSMDKNDIIDETGVLCSTDSLFKSNTINKSCTQEINDTKFNFLLSNLSSGTKYFYKAYASGKSNSVYGVTKYFTTEQIQLSTSVDNIEANDKESTYKIKVSSNSEWAVSSNQNWCGVSPITGSKQDSLSITIKENTTTSARQAIVTITAEAQTKKITINQMGRNESLSISSNYFSVSPENKSHIFTIQTNLSWSISSDQSWCIPSSTSGNGENTLSFTVSENTYNEERKAVLTVKAGTLTQEITIIQQSKSAILSVSSNSFSVSSNNNTYSFTITSNMNWTITSDQSWCIPSIAAGSNNQTISFDVLENATNQKRNATIIVKSGNLIQQIIITQTGTNQTLAVSNNSFIFGPEAGASDFQITSNTTWTISSNQSWCNISTTSGSNNKTISFSITPNISTQSRTAIIIVNSSALSVQITVTQEGRTEVIPTLSVSPETISVTAIEQTSNFDISSNTDWTISSDQSWCTPAVISGNGDKTISCSISENTQSQSRTAIITVSAGSISRKITMTQAGKEIPMLSLSHESISVTANEQMFSFDISSNTDWSISSDQSWCTSSVSSGNGNKTINCSISENIQSQIRTAIITVRISSLSKTITVIQNGKEVSIINIPDANFKAVLLKRFDIDKDNEISLEEARKVTYLSLENNNITSLEGLQYFVSLTYISCYNNQISEIDLSNCINLERLIVGKNNLTSLDVSKNIKLKELHCAYNFIEHLDISNNIELSRLYCIYNNLSSLNVSNNLALEELQCGENNLTHLNINNNKMLTYLTCSNNKLTTINLSNNTLLSTFYCCSNEFTSLDLSKNINLQSFECCRNQITDIDFSNNKKLTFINCYNNKLTKLDVSNNLLLERLDCWGNPLKALILKENHSIKILNKGNDCETIYK